jgi:putative acetyltransferase
VVRAEEPRDHDAVRALNRLAFGTNGEADLVDALRADGGDVISLVAEQDEIVVGHILFSPVTLSGSLRLPLAGLAPMAVLPACQRSGIGSQLVPAGLDACRTHGFAAAVVLGYPEFYPRFGFRRASEFG